MNMDAAIACPSCQTLMTGFQLPRNPCGELTIDVCFTCQCIWFDEFESAQLAPGGIIQLFQLIHEHRNDVRQPWPARLHCPRCEDNLLQGQDLNKNGRFTYHRCLQNHGRLSTFSAFLMEKGFVRQLSGSERADLAKKAQTILCSGCGAPVDIRTEAVCSHCHAPLVILDPEAVSKALAQYEQQAAARQTGQRISPDAMANLLIAREQQKSLIARQQQSSSLESSVDGIDLIVDGASLILDIFSD